jgi:hypothetical protein
MFLSSCNRTWLLVYLERRGIGNFICIIYDRTAKDIFEYTRANNETDRMLGIQIPYP